MYGVPPPSLLSYVPGTSQLKAVDSYLRNRDDILKELRSHLVRAQSRMKQFADQNRRDVSFAIVDFVYVKLQLYRQLSMARRHSMKLAPRFFGPYEVLAKIGSNAYRLALPAASKIHDVFYVSKLRKHLGSTVSHSKQLPVMDEISNELPQPESILETRVVQYDQYRLKTEIFVKWRGAPIENATWENAWRIQRSYPDFILAAKDS